MVGDPVLQTVKADQYQRLQKKNIECVRPPKLYYNIHTDIYKQSIFVTSNNWPEYVNIGTGTNR